MSHIKVQKLIYNEDGSIKSGSASIVDSVYGSFGKYHSKPVTREKLGKVLYLSADKRSGIFASPSRGLVEYNAITDTFTEIDNDDPRLPAGIQSPQTEVHTVFGDVYLMLKFLGKTGFISVLHTAFSETKYFERLLCHLLHTILRDGSKISCDNFILKSFASYLLSDVKITTLKTDSPYFSFMGQDHTRLAFFKAYVEYMRKCNPTFGSACYVDSTPLPNDIENNPFNAFSSHGLGGGAVMSRLVLILDKSTGLPLWYDVICGNNVDLNTISFVKEDVAASLNIKIDSLVLDAGYVSKELIDAHHIGSETTFIGRMPARKGYPYKTLYWQVKDLIHRAKYDFKRNSHTYFGYRKEVTIFKQQEYAYVYVDKYNALKGYSEYRDKHEAEFEKLLDREKDWLAVESGYFILLSNIEGTPAQILTEYFCRSRIETLFKTSKDYIHLLPISKWTAERVLGKILNDIISTIILVNFRKEMCNSSRSTSEIFAKGESLMCVKKDNGKIAIERPNKQLKEYYELMGIEIPTHLDLKDFIKDTLGVKL